MCICIRIERLEHFALPPTTVQYIALACIIPLAVHRLERNRLTLWVMRATGKITLPPAPAVAFVCSYNSYFPFSLLVAYAHPYIHHMKTCIIIQIYYKCANSHPFPSTHPVNHLFVNACLHLQVIRWKGWDLRTGEKTFEEVPWATLKTPSSQTGFHTSPNTVRTQRLPKSLMLRDLKWVDPCYIGRCCDCGCCLVCESFYSFWRDAGLQFLNGLNIFE